MDDFNIDQTIYLWDIADGRKKVTLKNLASGKNYSFAVGKSFTVGRNEKLCDLKITLEDGYISGRHLRFINHLGEIYVEDLHTRNGTEVNGKKISTRIRIRRGDVIKMGRSRFQVIL